MNKHKKESKNLVVGDMIKVAGLMCEIVRADWVYQTTKPKGRIRIFLKVVSVTSNQEEVVLLLPSGTSIETLSQDLHVV